MNDVDPTPFNEQSTPKSVVTILSIVMYLILVLIAAVVLTRLVTPIIALAGLGLFYVACLCYRRYRPTDTASPIAGTANATQRYIAQTLSAAQVARSKGGIKSLLRFFILPRRGGGLGSLGLLIICLAILSVFYRSGGAHPPESEVRELYRLREPNYDVTKIEFGDSFLSQGGQSDREGAPKGTRMFPAKIYYTTPANTYFPERHRVDTYLVFTDSFGSLQMTFAQ